MDTVNPRWLWVIVFGAGSIASIGFLLLYKMTKKRFAELQRQQTQLRTPSVESESTLESPIDTPTEIKPTSEELPEVEIKS